MKNKLRIGIEVQRLFRKKKHGMEVVALELIKELQQMDTHNEYIVYVREDVDKCIQETGNFKIREIRARSYATWEQIALPAAVKQDRLDILHSTCNTSALRLTVPLVLTLHDVIYLEKTDFKGTAYQNFGNIYRKLVVPRIVKMSKLVITVSNYEREVIRKRLNLPEDAVKVIYNAVSPKFTTQLEPRLIEQFRTLHTLPEKFMLFLGNTAPKKNTTNVVKAYVDYKKSDPDGLPLVILDYDRELVYEMLTKLNAVDLKPAFLFPGYIPSEDMPLLYNCCTLFLYPSLRESFGLPILEAMACGAPVITSDTSSMPEVAADAALFVDPFSSEDITLKMKQLSSDSGLMLKMKEKGIKRAAEFTWKSSAEQLLSVYHTLAE
ncbi:glycosyltransferase involved in cell wall biosynthesis [Pedobacter africanus]|uniref:Glycosyltransferase involved in cell wall biosynthesis n=1 Tax=Pedobacter africanus TaxID=151894 RepID=A0ACC6KTM1_9SPHI|nr:glycosyltransferase family 1 protein [Pedobacter africanus]MDR6782490.1 glycosyltransferase involved in cell wall biosynthesis [Pedobacter africanus]